MLSKTTQLNQAALMITTKNLIVSKHSKLLLHKYCCNSYGIQVDLIYCRFCAYCIFHKCIFLDFFCLGPIVDKCENFHINHWSLQTYTYCLQLYYLLWRVLYKLTIIHRHAYWKIYKLSKVAFFNKTKNSMSAKRMLVHVFAF